MHSLFLLVLRLPGQSQLLVEYLRGLHLTWTKIASIWVYLSRSILYRRLKEAGIELSSTYSELSDSDHDHTIAGIKQNHPNVGEIFITGHLYRLGIILPRARIRASIYCADATNTAIRRSITFRRWIYCVN